MAPIFAAAPSGSINCGDCDDGLIPLNPRVAVELQAFTQRSVVKAACCGLGRDFRFAWPHERGDDDDDQLDGDEAHEHSHPAFGESVAMQSGS